MSGSSQPPSLKKSTSSFSSKGQKSILGFFQKKSAEASPTAPISSGNSLTLPIGSPKKAASKAPRGLDQHLTPAPSSDAVKEEDEDEESVKPMRFRIKNTGLTSPLTPLTFDGASDPIDPVPSSSPSRKAYYLHISMPRVPLILCPD